MISIKQGQKHLIEAISDHRRCKRRRARGHRVLVDLPRQPTVQISGSGSELIPVPRSHDGLTDSPGPDY